MRNVGRLFQLLILENGFISYCYIGWAWLRNQRPSRRPDRGSCIQVREGHRRRRPIATVAAVTAAAAAAAIVPM